MAAVPHGPDQFFKQDNSQGNFLKHKACHVCEKYLGKTTFHRHFSAKFHKEELVRKGKTDMACPSCKVVHKNESLNKQEIVIYGLSSIAGACRNFLFRNLMRLNFETINGGRIENFTEIFKGQYGKSKKPLDVFLCTGVNDVRGSTEEEMIENFKAFYIAVSEQNDKNRVFVLRLIRPPSLYRMDSEREKIFNATIDRVNIFLKHANMELGNKKLPNLTHLGTGLSIGGNVKHNVAHWRERGEGLEKCVHLIENYRARICRKILQYIRVRLVGEKVFDAKFPHEG